MTTRRKRDLAVLTGVLMVATSIAMLIWPIVSRAG